MDREIIKINYKDKRNDRDLLEESKKAARLAALYTEKTLEMEDLNFKQKRYNREINERRRELKELYIEEAKEIVDGKYRRRRPSIMARVFSPQIIIFCFLSLIVYICLAKLAYIDRGYRAIGGEGFFLIFPLLILTFRFGNLVDKDARRRNK